MLGKKFALGFAIAIIFPMMINYGFDVFTNPAPIKIKIETVPQFWTTVCEDGKTISRKPTKEEQKVKLEIEERNEQLLLKYKLEKKEYIENKFYFMVPIGILSIIIGVFISIQSIGTGLIFGGLLMILQNYVGYWSDLRIELKFISLLIVFIVLIVTGYKKIK